MAAADIVNQAIQLIGGDQKLVAGNPPNFDGTATGRAAGLLYTKVVQTIGRQFGWEFSRSSIGLTLSGNVAPFPWAYEYLYPGSVVQVWQITPQSLADANNPLPTEWAIGNALVASEPVKVIHTNIPNAQAVVNNMPPDSIWDPLFRESVVRLLASELAMAVAGKPDTAQGLLESGGAFEQIGEQRRDN